MSHTPGPWRLYEGSKSPYCSTHSLSEILRPDCSGRLLARNPFVRNDAEILEWNANARLIAAAPELLEALLGLLNCTDLNLDEQDPSTYPLIDAARAAIMKATAQ